MFADPQPITIDGVAKSLNRLSTSNDGARYRTSDRALTLAIKHQEGKRHRHEARMTSDVLVANPLITGQFINSSMSCYLVVDVPVGFDVALAKKNVDGFLANLSATSGANVTKLLAGES